MAKDFARYIYLPRVKDPSVITAAVQDGLGLLLWKEESFACADGFDEATGRYRGLQGGQRVDVLHDEGEGLVVRAEAALKQMQADEAAVAPGKDTVTPGEDHGGDAGGTETRPVPPVDTKPHRYYGTVTLDATRVGRDAGRIADEVIAHLAGLVGSPAWPSCIEASFIAANPPIYPVTTKCDGMILTPVDVIGKNSILASIYYLRPICACEDQCARPVFVLTTSSRQI